jgi:UDP-N-acetylmuramoyl-tripeptide--D-alanyl-D-alanine ligase
MAKTELFDYLIREKGVIVVNYSDPMIKRWSDLNLKNIRSEYAAYSFDPDIMADYRFRYISESDGLMKFSVLADNREYKAEISLAGEYNIGNIAAAVSVGLKLGIPVQDIISGMRGFRAPDMRSQLVNSDGVTFYVDCYNANPDSMKASLCSSMVFNNYKRRIAVIGDMYELDGFSDSLHYEIGKCISESNFNAVFLVGNYAGEYLRGIKDNSPDIADVKSYAKDGLDVLKKDLKEFLEKGDFVFVKGSRAIGLEKIL